MSQVIEAQQTYLHYKSSLSFSDRIDVRSNPTEQLDWQRIGVRNMKIMFYSPFEDSSRELYKFWMNANTDKSNKPDLQTVFIPAYPNMEFDEWGNSKFKT